WRSLGMSNARRNQRRDTRQYHSGALERGAGLRHRTMARAIAVALSVGMAGLLAAPMAAHAESPQAADQGQASPDQAQELKGVVVTGSHIRRVDMETANPVLSVGRDQIEATGALTLGDAMQHLRAMTVGATHPPHHTSGNSYGTTHLSMRGLGPIRTLILVDGRRVLSNDVSSIPVAMIDHVEVLKNGASAVYGSDAIGGVVNF